MTGPVGALDGIRIADFSWVGAGPRATKDLADSGATVVKIESRRRLDLGRRSPPFAGDPKDPDGSAFFAQTNTSKLGVTIDLGDPEGVAVARKLIAWADVVVENFGPGYMERIGLGYADLQAIRPDIILASVSVAGRSGPMAGFRGYGNSAAAHSGHAAMSGWPGSEPHMPPFAYGDVVAPMVATLAVLAALEHRDRTGQGQHVDVSQIEPMVHVIADLFAAEGLTDKPGNGDPVMAPHGVFPCAGDDRWIAIAVADDVQWQALCRVLGDDRLAGDPRFATADGRRREGSALADAVGGLTRGWDRHRLMAALAEAGVPAGAVQDGRDVFEDGELRTAGHFVAVDHAVLGTSMMPAPPMRLHDTPFAVRPPPRLGEHNHQVLIDMLGLPEAAVADLEARGVLA